MKKLILFLSVVTLFLSFCSNSYSNGERIGTVNKLSKKGLVFDSWEGHLNLTQTGMTSTDGWDFSIDNDHEPEGLITSLDSAANCGWKVKLTYTEVSGFNWFSNRGETDYFVSKMEILDRDFTDPLHLRNEPSTQGHIIDTIYVIMVDKSQLK